MTLRILLVDDEELALDRLRELFNDIDDVEIIGMARTSEQAREAITKHHPDVVMLDIQMPGKSGMSLAADLDAESRPEIVFVTAFEHFAPDAFAVDATDYLLKPVRFDRLRQAISRARRRRTIQNIVDRMGDELTTKTEFTQEFWIPVSDGSIRLAVDMIDWIEAAKDYVLFHTATRSYLYRISMGALEKCLDPEHLIRVHRSAFVCPDNVVSIERRGKGAVALTLRDGAVVQVGPSYVKATLGRLTGNQTSVAAAN